VKTAGSLRRLAEKHAGLDATRYGNDMIIWGVLMKVVCGSRPCHQVPKRFIKSELRDLYSAVIRGNRARGVRR